MVDATTAIGAMQDALDAGADPEAVANTGGDLYRGGASADAFRGAMQALYSGTNRGGPGLPSGRFAGVPASALEDSARFEAERRATAQLNARAAIEAMELAMKNGFSPAAAVVLGNALVAMGAVGRGEEPPSRSTLEGTLATLDGAEVDNILEVLTSTVRGAMTDSPGALATAGEDLIVLAARSYTQNPEPPRMPFPPEPSDSPSEVLVLTGRFAGQRLDARIVGALTPDAVVMFQGHVMTGGQAEQALSPPVGPRRADGDDVLEGAGLPVEGPITDPFRAWTDEVGVTHVEHTGIDIGADAGAEIRASAAGKVVYVGRSQRSGQMGMEPEEGQEKWAWNYSNSGAAIVIIEHANGLMSVYRHMNDVNFPMVTRGEIAKGAVIGHVGDTGADGQPHLHLEVGYNLGPSGRPDYRDPIALLVGVR